MLQHFFKDYLNLCHDITYLCCEKIFFSNLLPNSTVSRHRKIMLRHNGSFLKLHLSHVFSYKTFKTTYIHSYSVEPTCKNLFKPSKTFTSSINTHLNSSLNLSYPNIQNMLLFKQHNILKTFRYALSLKIGFRN